MKTSMREIVNKFLFTFQNKTWNKRIERAEQKGQFNFIDRYLADSWSTCAVGEQIFNNSDLKLSLGRGYPLSQELEMLGVEFQDAVIYDHISEAKDIVNKISVCIYELRQDAYKEWMKKNDDILSEPIKDLKGAFHDGYKAIK